MQEEGLKTGNDRFQHFGTFKRAIEAYPGRTFEMFRSHASEDFMASKYIVQSMIVFGNVMLDCTLKVMLGSSLAVFTATYLLHRRRAWVLSSTGGLRSLFFKYLPVWTIYGGYKFYYETKIPTSLVHQDFGQLQEQFCKMYSEHGDYIKQGLKTLEQ